MSFLNCATLPDHIETACQKYKKGGFPSLAIIDEDHTITDWTNGSQWSSNIASGKIKIVNRIKAAISDPSAIKSDNPVACGAQQILDGFDWKFSCTDGNRNVFNDSFYTNLNNKAAFVALWNKDENEILVIDREVVFTCNPNYPDSNRAHQFYKIEGDWVSPKDWFPGTHSAPTGVFNY